MEPCPTTRPLRSAALAVGAFVALVALGVLGGGSASQAQSSGPEITVEAVHPLTGGSFHFIVFLTDRNGDPLTGTTVTATPTSPNGDTGDAVALPSSGDGTYQGPVPLPEDGTWTVQIASADPAASIEYGFQVSGDTGTPVGAALTTQPADTTVPATTATTAPTASTAAAATTASPATTASEADDETAAAPARDEDDGSGFPAVLLILGAALVVALAGVPLALRTIRSSGDNDTDADASAAGPRISD